MRNAFFVSANKNYLPCLNTFLNSLQKQLVKTPFQDSYVVYVVHLDVPDEYFEAAKAFYCFEVVPVKIDTSLDFFKGFSKMEILKAGRYLYMFNICSCASNGIMNVCLMDADLMVVSPDFFHLFNMVEGTDVILGCNERFKWHVSDKFQYKDGEPIFRKPRRLHKFHCNSPLFFSLIGATAFSRILRVLKEYFCIVYRAKEQHQKKGTCKVGDIFAWNFAIAKQAAEDYVILMPMSVMTQVHQTAYKNWTRLEKRGGAFYTRAGDTVLSLHGRVHKQGFGKFSPEKLGVSKEIIESVNDLYRAEWCDLNFNQTVTLDQFMPVNPYWEKLLDKFGKDYWSK